jgi:uncharacterized protein YbaR (Trm112 family)
VHIQLTDVLTCPKCGPESGLIVRSDIMKDRRIIEGVLGCPQCETHYPIRGGVALLGPPNLATETREAADPEQASIRMAALLGATEPLGFVLVLGPAASAVAPLARIMDNTEIIADAPSAPTASLDSVSRMTVGERLPFYSSRLRAIWLSGDAADRLLEEGARVLHPLGRLVLEPSPMDARARLEAAGLRVLAEQDRTVLAVRGQGPQFASGHKPSLS